jgi:hypothetical protein
MRGSLRQSGAWLVGVGATVACLAVVFATPSGVTWIVDGGSKALLAKRLLSSGFGDLHLDYPAALLDPSGESFPGGGFSKPHQGGFVSIFAPGYSALAAPFLAVLGDPGLRVPAALGVGACALLFAVWLMPVVGRGRALAGAGVLAFATPLFFYGVTVWEHSLCIALGLGAWIAAGEPRPARLVLAGLLAGAACWLREEQILMAGAIAVSGALRWRRVSAVALFLAAASLPVLALGLFNQLSYGDPLGVHLRSNLAPVTSGAADDLARQLLGVLAGFGGSGPETIALGVALPLAWGAGWLAGRRDPPGLGLWVAALLPILAWATGLYRVIGASDPLAALVRYNGLLLQVPLCGMAGLGLARLTRDPSLAPLRLGVYAGLGFLVAALVFGIASGSPLGYGVHWGPRKLLPALPALVALWLVAISPETSSRARRAAWMAPVAAGVASTLLSIGFLAEQKAEARRFADVVLEHSDDVVVSTHPYAPVQLFSLWGERRMLVAERAGAMMQVASTLGRQRTGEFLLIGKPSLASHTVGDGVRCEVVVRHRGRRFHYLDADLQHCKVDSFRGSELSPRRSPRLLSPR